MALVMAGLMAASMTACQTKTEPQPTGGQESESASAEAPAGTEAPAAAGKTYKIGIIQLTQHAALDKTNEGFVAALKDAGLDCEIDQQNASGDRVFSVASVMTDIQAHADARVQILHVFPNVVGIGIERHVGAVQVDGVIEIVFLHLFIQIRKQVVVWIKR